MAQRDGIRVGLFFGTTSGVITTCGLLVGLASGTGSLVAVLGGILVIAVADSLSDALGIHVSEESKPGSNPAQIWTATITTFLSKFTVAASFALPVWLLPLQTGIYAALVWGALLIIALSWRLARMQDQRPGPIVAEHLAIAVLVIGLSHLVGIWVRHSFGT